MSLGEDLKGNTALKKQLRTEDPNHICEGVRQMLNGIYLPWCKEGYGAVIRRELIDKRRLRRLALQRRFLRLQFAR